VAAWGWFVLGWTAGLVTVGCLVGLVVWGVTGRVRSPEIAVWRE
jgi:hypothetical protein